MIKEKLKKYKLVRILADNLHLQKNRNIALNENGYAVLEQISTLFRQINITHFPDFGTLLGLVREGKLLGHDCDIDFGVLNATDKDKEKIRLAVSELGYQRTEHYCVDGIIREESYEKGNNSFDVFYYEKDRTGYHCYIFCRIDHVKYKDKYEASAGIYRYPMDIVPEIRTIHDISLPIPQNAEKLLEMKYGKDWRIPNRHWHYWFDANVEDTGKIAQWYDDKSN